MVGRAWGNQCVQPLASVWDPAPGRLDQGESRVEALGGAALLLPQVIRMVGESQEPVGSTVGGGSSGSNKMPTLEEYGTNLTALAEEVRAWRLPA